MLNLLLPALLALSPQDPVPEAATVVPATVAPVPATAAPVPATAAPVPATAASTPAAEAKALSFSSEKFAFKWDQLLPLTSEVDGLKVKSIFFNKRSFRSGPFKGKDFGTRAQVEVTNTASTSRTPGFAVAVFDADERLLGVATAGPKLGGVAAGTTETFDFSFHQVLERLPKGDHFYLTIELTP